MVKFKFFVHCAGWSNGGYENVHYAETEQQARDIIESWNADSRSQVSLISVETVSDEEFARDYIYY